MTKLLVSLPMYAVPDAALTAFWHGLRHHLRATGIDGVPDALSEPGDLLGHWLGPDLLLSQTCGFPLTTTLAGRVRYVATPVYDAEGCEGATYSSAVVVRSADPARTLADLRGRRAAFNGADSQSGMNALRVLVAPLARDGRFFGEVIETGAHRRSIAAIVEGRADVAAVDAVTLTLLRRYHPAEVAGIRVLTMTASAPSLPFITAASTPDETVLRLRAGLGAACADPALADARSAMLLGGIEILPDTAYATIPAMIESATALGYPVLA